MLKVVEKQDDREASRSAINKRVQWQQVTIALGPFCLIVFGLFAWNVFEMPPERFPPTEILTFAKRTVVEVASDDAIIRGDVTHFSVPRSYYQKLWIDDVMKKAAYPSA